MCSPRRHIQIQIMLGKELHDMAQRDTRLRACFAGVFAANELPRQLPVRHLLIVNCCNRNLPGEHWVAVCQTSPNEIEFFDSFGQQPILYNLEAKLPSAQRIVYNTKQLQSVDSQVCGHYCLFYCYYRARGYSMNQIVSRHFSRDTSNNDSFVFTRVNNILKMK